MALRLVDPDASALFTIPQDHWTALNKRVGEAVSWAGAITPGPTLIARLVSVSQAWASTTFAQIVDMSGRIDAFSQDAVSRLAAVERAMAPLKDPVSPLPAPLAAAIRATFADLGQKAADVNAACHALSPAVSAFVEANKAVDQEAIVVFEREGWADAVAAIDTVDDAVSRILGAWDAIADDLNDVARGTIPLSMEILLSLGLESAIRAWTNVGSEAAAFQPMAAGQQQYYSGEWYREHS
jgi:hypothetical protein